MFLDDRLYQTAKSVDYKHWTHKSVVQKLWTSIVVDHICEENKRIAKDQSSSDYDIYIVIKRCKTHWYNTLKKLEKEGIRPFGVGSFETFVSEHTLFSGFREQILNYIK
jgi:hypothetical protein